MGLETQDHLLVTTIAEVFSEGADSFSESAVVDLVFAW